MNLPRFSVERPIFASMVACAVVILGVFSLMRLRIDLLPAIEPPTLTIRTNYEGASPEVMERTVTQTIEEIVGTVPGVDELTSVTAEGVSNVTVSFVWGTDIDIAALDVQTRLEQEADELPEEADRPRVSKFDIASFPVVVLGVGSTLDPVELTTVIDKQVRYRFARIPGVAQVDMWGEYEREIRIEVFPERIKAIQLPLDGVLDAILSANLDLPAGQINRGRYEVTLRAPAEFDDTDQIRDTVVAVRSDAPVTIGEIAKVVDSHRKRTRIVRINGKTGLRLGIRKEADANTVEVASAILAEVDRVNRDFPQVEITSAINQGSFIERSIDNVANSVLYGGALAVFVLLFFLRSVRSTTVIALAIPLSMIATFTLMFVAGFTLNLMTLGGLALGVGMMVDSSIVVLENIFRRRDEEDEPPRVAAIAGATEVAPAIVASTITTLVVFLPLAFIRGISGLLFKELAYVIGLALVCSLIVSLSLVPMLASRLLRERAADAGGVFARIADVAGSVFRRMEDEYRGIVRFVLRHPWATVLLSAAALGGSLLLVPMIGSEFLPPSDEGEVRVIGEMEVGTRLDVVDRQSRVLEQLVMPQVPEAVSSVVSMGASGRNPDGASEAELRISLTPATERTRSNVEIANTLRRKITGQVPGMTIRTRAPQGQFILERLLGTEDGLTVEVRGYELDALDLLAKRVVTAVETVPGITDARTTRKSGTPQEMIRIDRRKAAALGLTVRDVARVIETAVAGRLAGEFRTEGDAHRILVQLHDAEHRSIDEILDLQLRTPTGEEIALRQVAHSETGRGPVLIDRKDQQRIVRVEANVAGRDLGSVAADVDAKLRAIARPPGYDLAVTGNYEEQQRAFDELIVSLALALLLVYMVLACQYESLRDPLVVMMSVPLAAIGVLVTLFLTDTTLNVQSYVGCIMLGGIVVNNAILLVDQATRLRRDGRATADAVAEAGRRRLRPILMTTLTTVLGLLPLALGIGEGADAQAPLARAVVGGLTGSTLITLLLIPVVYAVFHRDKREAA